MHTLAESGNMARGSHRLRQRFIGAVVGAKLGSAALICMNEFVEPKTRTYHGRVGAGRRTVGMRGGAGRGLAGLDAEEGSVRPGDNRSPRPKGIADCPGRFPGSADKRNTM